MDVNKNFLVGVFDDEDVWSGRCIEECVTSGVKIHEVFSPFPVHGLDEALGYKRITSANCSISVWNDRNFTGACSCRSGCWVMTGR